MAKSEIGSASFMTQANALLLKNITYEKRNLKRNVALILYPCFLCLLILGIQYLTKKVDSFTEKQCMFGGCPEPSPPELPVFLQIPPPPYRAARADSTPYIDLPHESCKKTGSCPVTILVTALNQTLGKSLVRNPFTNNFNLNSSDKLYILSNLMLGTDINPENSYKAEPSLESESPLYLIQRRCSKKNKFSVAIETGPDAARKEVMCVKGLFLWRNTSSSINDELFRGYWRGNQAKKINDILAAYDLSNTNEKNFNVNIWYNSTYSYRGDGSSNLLRVVRSVNMASNAYLKFLRGAGVKILLDFVKTMPLPSSPHSIDIVGHLGVMFFMWVVLQLFPVILTSVVYEKQQNLRIMMKMHGLRDGPYWLISYIYFLFLSSMYMLSFVVFGSLVGLHFFTSNKYTVQFLFYFMYSNLQISFALLVATFCSNVKTATVIGNIYVFGSGLIGTYLFEPIIEDPSVPRVRISLLELLPTFSLYLGLYEFKEFAGRSTAGNSDGMSLQDLKDGTTWMRELLIIMFVEWLLLLLVAYYFDQVMSSGSGVKKHPLFFLKMNQQKNHSSYSQMQESKVSDEVEKHDVSKERKKVEQLLHEHSTSHTIICDDLKKIYPPKDGNPEKIAVRGLSLALPRGECFGMLGTNGAGKTSSLSMMIGLTMPTSGTAYVEGLDIRTDMDKIYTIMGVCPQHDLLWESLTGREHLLFYGRLKNLQGDVLTQAVEESLKRVNLFHGGVADKLAGQYSGGMKRRLSVAISLIGDPKIVYLDEPSTGLDPASRKLLWDIVKTAKKNRAIILTTHSMEEAEVLCDRLGIFVNGAFECIGNSKELKARYGGYYVFTITTSSNKEVEVEVEKLVYQVSPNANKTYHLSGTQKFELPKEVRIADVFQAVEDAKRKFTINAWGLTDTTLEDVFIKVAQSALGESHFDKKQSSSRSSSSARSESCQSDQPIHVPTYD